MQKRSNSWLSSKVGVFWQEVNWENQASVNSVFGIDRRMSVKQFFQSIPWTVSTSPPPPTPAPPTNTRNDTLNDFLSDISKFF